MNWEAAGAIGEILGAIAVFVSLIYLAIQIRSNSKLVHSQNIHSATLQTQQMMALQASDSASSAIARALDGEELTTKDAVILEAYVASAFIAFWNRYEHHRQGLPNLDWVNSRASIADYLALPWIRGWWEEYGASRFEKDFVEEVNQILSESIGDEGYIQRIKVKGGGT